MILIALAAFFLARLIDSGFSLASLSIPFASVYKPNFFNSECAKSGLNRLGQNVSSSRPASDKYSIRNDPSPSSSERGAIADLSAPIDQFLLVNQSFRSLDMWADNVAHCRWQLKSL